MEDILQFAIQKDDSIQNIKIKEQQISLYYMSLMKNHYKLKDQLK